jgi:plastocyanin
MKRLLLAAACVCIAAAGDLSAASVAGKVTFLTKRGQRPNPAETMVWLEPIDAKAAKRPAAGTYQIVTRGKALLPHILPVPAGSTVSFPNQDPIAHNLFSISSANSFDLGFYRTGPGKSQKFDKPGIVNVYCNVHPNMSAVIHVMPSPYYVFADATGAYAIEAPPGKYRVVAWNEMSGTAESTIEVAASGVTGNLALTIDGRNFRLVEHMNKAGRPYTAPKEY